MVRSVLTTRQTNRRDKTAAALIRACVGIGVSLLAAPVFATCVSHSTSTYTYTNCSDGTSSMSRSVGSNTYTTTSRGGSITSYTTGNTTYHTGPEGSGTSVRSGNYEQHTWSDGSTGTSQYQSDSAQHRWTGNTVGAGARYGVSKSAAAASPAAARRAEYGHIAGGPTRVPPSD